MRLGEEQRFAEQKDERRAPGWQHSRCRGQRGIDKWSILGTEEAQLRRGQGYEESIVWADRHQTGALNTPGEVRHDP